VIDRHIAPLFFICVHHCCGSLKCREWQLASGKWQLAISKCKTKNQKPKTKNQKPKTKSQPRLLEPATALLIMIANGSFKNPAGFAMGSRPGLSDFHALR
jgi:hypothetical protein